MKVRVKLYATLREYAPKGTEIGQEFEFKLKKPSLEALIDSLGFSKDQAKIIMINGERVTDITRTLRDNDLIVIFPPIGGG